MDTKVCSKCKTEKPTSSFYKSGVHPSGKVKFRGECNVCAKQGTYDWRSKHKSEYNNYSALWRSRNPDKQHATDIKRNYGLSIEEYNKFLASQNCQCKICGKQHDPTKKRGRLYVDHCHNSKKVRGLLCAQCNTMVGKGDISLLKRAISYLESN